MKTLGRQNINVYNSWKIFCNWFQHSRHDPLPLLQLSPGQTNSIEYLINWNLFSLLVNQQGTTQPVQLPGSQRMRGKRPNGPPQSPFLSDGMNKIAKLAKIRDEIPQDSLWEQPLRALRQNSLTCPDSSRAQSEQQFQNRLSPPCSTVVIVQNVVGKLTKVSVFRNGLNICRTLTPAREAVLTRTPPSPPSFRLILLSATSDPATTPSCDIQRFRYLRLLPDFHSCLRKLTASISMHVFQPGVWFTPALLQKIFTCVVFLAAFLCFITWSPKISHLRYLVIEVSLTSKV